MRTNNIRGWTLVALLAVAGILACSSSASADWRQRHYYSGYGSSPHGSYYTGQMWSPSSGYGSYSPGYGGYSGSSGYTGYSYYPGYTLSSGVTPNGIVIGSVGAPYYYGGRYYSSSPVGGYLFR